MKKQIKELVKNELVINKSKFISFLFPVSSLDDAKDKIKKYKKEYNDATHVCYSYILDENTFKFYDDGEPASTAGSPIYQVLKNNNLIYTMCVVVRYFGGTKLGVGGLIKAYTNSVLNCLNIASIVNYEELLTCNITTNYSTFERLEYFLKNNSIQIVSKDFDENIKIIILINKKNLEFLQDSFQNSIIVSY